MIVLAPVTAVIGWAIPAKMLPALSVKYGVPCEGIRPSVTMRDGSRGYRSVLCGELSSPPLVLHVNPVTGRIVSAKVAVR